MTNPLKAGVFGFLLVVLALFLWIGYAITELTGGERKAVSAVVEISPEGGEAIYWGKGRCFTCHSVGGQGSAVRGPNHGQFGEKFPLPMGARAVGARQGTLRKDRQDFTAVDYIIESLASPGAYVVEGYKNEMAVVYAPPISLNLERDQGGGLLHDVAGRRGLDMEAIDTKPSEITQAFYNKIAAAGAAGGGDPGAGEADVYRGQLHGLPPASRARAARSARTLTGIAAKG